MNIPKDTLHRKLQPLLGTNHATPPVIVFANNGYREIADNWIRAACRLPVKNFWFIALDRNIHDYLAARNIRVILLELDTRLQVLWKFRIRIFRELVDNHIDFIHSDADAVWLRDPVERYYTRHGDIDVVASQGTVWPPDVFRQWQFVLCCGFFVMRANNRTASFLHALETDVEQTGDDQVSFNRLLLQYNVHWEIKSPYRMRFRNAQLLASRDMIIGHGNKLTVGMIPFAEVPRLHLEDNKPYVEHPLAPNENDKKKDMFKEIGLWI
jgi:hypothetical protein